MANHKETWNAADVRCPFFMGEHAVLHTAGKGFVHGEALRGAL